ncbi:ornithine monooxygenase, partial [Escherichia coli]|nr:ornithine monooxygenase [Escherichia coli]
SLCAVERDGAEEQGIGLALRNLATGEVTQDRYDLVILATGYERQLHRHLLEPLADFLGDYQVGRDYRLQSDPPCQAAVYVQGF